MIHVILTWLKYEHHQERLALVDPIAAVVIVAADGVDFASDVIVAANGGVDILNMTVHYFLEQQDFSALERVDLD